MPIEPVFERINYTCPSDSVKSQIKIDCKSELATEQIDKVLGVNAFVSLSQSEAVNGQIRYGGKINFYISYINAEGEVKKCECGSEFTGIAECATATEGVRCKVNAYVEKTEVMLDGIFLAVSAFVGVNASVVERKEISALTGGDNLITDSKDIPVVKSFGVREGVFPLEEQFELDFPVQEVLSHRANAVITAVQCGVGAIIIDGEVFVSVIALQKNQKNTIIRENKVLPFRYELECDDAMPSVQATARVREKSFKTDISVDEEKGTSTLISHVNLQFEGEAFVVTSTSLVADAFSTADELELLYDEFPYYKACEQYVVSGTQSGKCSLDLPQGSTLLAVAGENVEIVSQSAEQTGVVVNGVISATGYFCDQDGKIFSRRLETPFEKNVEYMGDKKDTVEIKCVVDKCSARISGENQIDMDYELFFTVYPCERSSIKYVKDIKCVGCKKTIDSAISVYIALDGEDLWSLSKRLNTSPEALISTNKELQFPLTGNERIVVYRQK